MNRKALEDRARQLGYEPDPDDTDADLVSVIREREQRKAA